MDTPKPPEDLELRNIIDKLAQFVARNGPDFEQMTMNKQHGNPKFMFLFGGEFNAYYRYRVAAEQQQLQQPQTFHQHPPASQPQIPPPTLPMPPVGNNNFFPNHHQLPLPPIPSFPPVSQSPSFNNNFIQQPPAHPHAFHPHPHNPPSMPPQPPQHCPPILFPGLPDEPFQFGQKPVPNWQPPPIPPPLPPQPPPQLKTQQIGPNNLQSVQKNDFESDNRLDIQIKQLNDHIKESEKNLNAQKEVIMGIEMEQQINEMIIKQLDDELKRMCEDFNINLNEFDKILQPIIDTCRKESIANGKIWIFNHCNNDEQYDAVAKHLLKRVTRTNESFDGKLHIMYLINDIFNHCMRKNDKKLKTAIINIIVPAFATVMIDANDERKLKMNKLLKIWETNQYLDDALLEKLRQSNQSLDDYKIDLRNKYREQIKSIEQKQSDKYKKIEKQHLDFVAHANEQIKQLNSQKSMNNIRQSQSFESPSNGILPSSLPVSSGIPFAPPTVVNSFVHSTSPISSNLMSPSLPPPHLPLQRLPFPSPFHPPPPQHHPPHFYPTANNFQMYPTIPSYASAIMPSSPQILSDTLPSQSNGARPYFESPAALMTTLIKLEDFDYNPIDPKLIEFPTLEPPTEHLLQALDAFYSPPTHEHPRNADGWEKLGLYEFFKRKSQARKEYEINVLGQKEDDNKNNVDTKSINDPDSSSISTTNNKDKDKKHKDKDKQNDKHQKNEKASTSKKSYKEFKEKSRSPSHHRSRKRSRSRSRSRSPHRKRSKSPKKSRSNKSSSRSRSKSPEFSKVKNNINDNSKYSNDNKNPLMTKRMTWSSSTGFTIKDTKTDHTNEGQYVGLGVDSHHHHHEKKSPDPFESFRRNKGQEYMQRIRDGGFAGANVVRRD